MSESAVEMTDPDDVFAKVAKHVAARNVHVAEADDIKQELWVWWLSHDKPDVTDDPDWAVMRTLHTVAERYAAKERAARVPPTPGYTPDAVMVLVETLVNPPSDSDCIGAELADVLTAVANLPDELRVPLVAYAAGDSYRSIADSSDLSLATAFRRVQQALNDVANTLNGEPQT